jgi:hypothetical protein
MWNRVHSENPAVTGLVKNILILYRTIKLSSPFSQQIAPEPNPEPSYLITPSTYISVTYILILF